MPGMLGATKEGAIFVMESFIKIIGSVIWPAVVIIIYFSLRRKIFGLLDRAREIRGPGNVHFILDPKKIEDIVEKGVGDNIPSEKIAENIVNEASTWTVEFDIMKSLFLAENGIDLEEYLTIEGIATLEKLISNGYVKKREDGYVFTKLGREAFKMMLRTANIYHPLI